MNRLASGPPPQVSAEVTTPTGNVSGPPIPSTTPSSSTSSSASLPPAANTTKNGFANANQRTPPVTVAQQPSQAQHQQEGEDTLCGNFMIFLSLRVYVKSIFEECRNSKTAVLAILGALKMIDLANFSLQKM